MASGPVCRRAKRNRSVDRLMEVVAELVGGDDEEYLKPLSVSFVDAPVAGFDTVTFDFISDALNIDDKDRGAILARVASVDRETDPRSVAFHDDSWDGVVVSLDFDEAECVSVVFGGDVDVFHRQGENVIGKREGCFEELHGMRSDKG